MINTKMVTVKRESLLKELDAKGELYVIINARYEKLITGFYKIYKDNGHSIYRKV